MADSQPLRDIVTTQMKEAMKAGEKTRVGALRLIMAALKDREIEARGAGKIVSRSDELALLTKMVKSRQESAAIYAEAGRAELAAQENAEVEVINDVPAEADERGRGDGGGEGRHRRDRRGERQGHGQGGQRAEGSPPRPDGLRQGERDREKPARRLTQRLRQIRVRPRLGGAARGWLTAGPFRIPCALGPAGIVRLKREGDRGTPAGRFRLLWAYYRPDRWRPVAGGPPLFPMRPDQGWCEEPSSPRYNRPVRLPAADCTDRMWREDRLYDLTFVLDQNFSRRARGKGSAIFFHLARPDLGPTAGCVAISPSAMRRLAPRLARGCVMVIG